MINKKKIVDQIESIEAKMNVLRNDKYECLKRLAEINCPFKKGDRLVDRNGKKAVVNQVIPIDSSYRDYFQLNLLNIKKDGNIGMRRIYFYDSDKWRKDEQG